MNKGDLQAEEASRGMFVDQLGARPRRGSASARGHVLDLVREWCIPGPRLARNLPTGVSRADRR